MNEHHKFEKIPIQGLLKVGLTIFVLAGADAYIDTTRLSITLWQPILDHTIIIWDASNNSQEGYLHVQRKWKGGIDPRFQIRGKN